MPRKRYTKKGERWRTRVRGTFRQKGKHFQIRTPATRQHLPFLRREKRQSLKQMSVVLQKLSNSWSKEHNMVPPKVIVSRGRIRIGSTRYIPQWHEIRFVLGDSKRIEPIHVIYLKHELGHALDFWKSNWRWRELAQKVSLLTDKQLDEIWEEEALWRERKAWKYADPQSPLAKWVKKGAYETHRTKGRVIA